MERSEETEERWRGVDEEMLKRERRELDGKVVVADGLWELEVSDTEEEEDEEEEEGCPPLITACRKGMTEVARRLLEAGADATLCTGSRRTALHVSPSELRGEVLGWMSRPHLPPQAQLLQACWLGDLRTLQHLLAQADGWDVNVPNSDGVTALMLAVRDVDLFQGAGAPLPWDHRPVEVVKTLLGLSADLQIRDHGGCSALHYAASINSPLKDEIIQMMAESLRHTDTGPVSPLAPDESSWQDLDSDIGDSDVELDIENLHPHQSTAGYLTRMHARQQLSYSHTGEVLESPGRPALSDHHKGLSQDKGVPLCFQNAMETLRDIRQAHQDAGRGSSRGGLSLPSLMNSGRRWGPADPVASGGVMSTRTLCVPVPPKPRQRTRSVVAASRSPPGLLSVAEPSQLSQSAPSLMEPLLCSNTMMQARAHIQSRLGSQDSVNEQKGALSSLTPRTPKRLAPLSSKPRDSAGLPVLKHRVPLKPISRSPLCSRAWLRRERPSRGSPRTGPLTSTRGGSEESRSSSSQSSIDLEDEKRGLQDSDLKCDEDRLLQPSNVASATDADLVEETRLHFQVQSRISQIPPIHRSAHHLEGDPIDRLATERAMDSHCEGKATNMKEPVNIHSHSDLIEDEVNNEMPYTSKSKGKNHAGLITDLESDITRGIVCNVKDDHSDAFPCSGWDYGNELQHAQPTEVTMKDPCDDETQTVDPILCSAERAESIVSTAVGKIPLVAGGPNPPPTNVDSKTDRKMLKASKPVQNRETTTVNRELRASNQSNPSFNLRASKDRSRNTSKSNLKCSSVSTQVKDKTRKSPELMVSGETTGKVKSKLNSVKSAHRSSDTPWPRKKVIDHPQSKRANLDKSSNGRAQPPAREPKSARQLKRLGVAVAPRSKSAVDFITYRDMFQQIQSRDGGPVICEMFAGPIYDNLRFSSTCEKTKGRQVQSAPSRKVQQSNKIKHRPLKQPQCKLRRTPGEGMVISTKSKARLASSRAKPHLAAVSRKDAMPGQDAEVVLSQRGEIGHNGAQEKAVDHLLSIIEEALSRYQSETLTSDCKTLTMPTTSSHANDSQVVLQEAIGISPAANYGRVPEPELPQSSPQPKINPWTSSSCSSSSSSSSSSQTLTSPVYQKFLDEVGDGPLTDDLLQCLAEELISLDERDVSTGSCPENTGSSTRGSIGGDLVTRRNVFPKVISLDSAALLGSGVAAGDTISWTRGEMLGRGAYGTVYCGLTSQGQLIAVKQVSLDTSDPEAAKREYNHLQGEVDLLKALRHINVVGFLGTSLYQHVVSIFMEYIPGGSIASVLHRFGPLPERVLALYTHQILEGVAFLHLNRVIHRDLKGNNVMLMPTGVIKLIDFGCARRLSCPNHTASNSGDLLKSVDGTPYWMAPEVINDTGYGRKSDVWSVGCTVFEMATGKPPLAHMDKMAALFYIGAQRGLMPSLPDGFSHNARAFVNTCLTSDQRLRPSADKLLKHPFIPQKETGVNSWETQKKNCCGHLQGRCG